MNSFSFRNRIAFYYIISTALLITVVFLVIYQMVSFSVFNHINADIEKEVEKHLEEIEIDRNDTYLIQVDQWKAREHNTVDVNPVFVQFYDLNNELIDKSPNLKNLDLKLFKEEKENQLIDTYLNKKPIRQIQVPLFDDDKVIGHLVVAMSLDDSKMVLTNLRTILVISFPLILIFLFLIARFIVGRSIKPIDAIIETSNQISRENLTTRINLPQNKDELYLLSKTINDLLDRVENAIDREKQFTSDASHELRTPLAVIKGTLEVLIRKPRNQAEYEEKINFCVKEVDRLNQLVDELLLLARFEDQKQSIKHESVYLNSLLLDVITRFSDKIRSKNLKIETSFSKDFVITNDSYLISIIFSNLLSNAIKYSQENGTIFVNLENENNHIVCKISDNGIGISKEDLEKIGSRFYRSQKVEHAEIKGTGLGLSIVKRLTELLAIQFNIESQLKLGTTVTLRFY
jgi:signal transduction histidine kinase